MANTPPSTNQDQIDQDRDFEKYWAVEFNFVRSILQPRTTGQDEEDGTFLTLADPDLVDCPICVENLSIPVFQCLNGHLACSSCCLKVRNKCPTCSSTVGHNRCRPIEKIIESVKIPCEYSEYGCTEMVFRCRKRDHSYCCLYKTSQCPIPECDLWVKNLPLHYYTKHSDSKSKRFCYACCIPISLELEQKYLILEEEHEGTIFLLNNEVENFGHVISVCCVQPISFERWFEEASERGFSYDLLATNGGRSVKVQSFGVHICDRHKKHTRSRSFLMVRSDFFGSRGQLELELSISLSPVEFQE